MNYRRLDMASYNRRDHFNYFNSLAYPYVGTTVNLDITDFLHTVKAQKLPFFLTFCYCVSRAANSVPEFRQRIDGDGIIEFDNCRTSHTVALEDKTYCYCALDSSLPFSEYLPYAVQAQEEAKLQKTIAETEDDTADKIFISTLPWFSYVSFTQPVPSPADSNPRITWGRYFSQNDRIQIPVTVLCNHALVDGAHIADFYSELETQLTNLAANFNP